MCTIGGIGGTREAAASGGVGGSSSSVDPYQLKTEITAARERLSKLKHELQEERQQIATKQAGLDTLTQ